MYIRSSVYISLYICLCKIYLFIYYMLVYMYTYIICIFMYLFTLCITNPSICTCTYFFMLSFFFFMICTCTYVSLRLHYVLPGPTHMNNLSLASALPSASMQSCTTARAEEADTLIFLIPYLNEINAHNNKPVIQNELAAAYRAWPSTLPSVGCGWHNMHTHRAHIHISSMQCQPSSFEFAMQSLRWPVQHNLSFEHCCRMCCTRLSNGHHWILEVQMPTKLKMMKAHCH